MYICVYVCTYTYVHIHIYIIHIYIYIYTHTSPGGPPRRRALMAPLAGGGSPVPSVCPSVYPSVHLSVYLTRLSICLSNLYVSLSVRPSVRPSVRLRVSSVCPSNLSMPSPGRRPRSHLVSALCSGLPGASKWHRNVHTV